MPTRNVMMQFVDAACGLMVQFVDPPHDWMKQLVDSLTDAVCGVRPWLMMQFADSPVVC